ncbi:MAG: XRE family transcriptional regulator [Bacteroidales bacterium]|jgi:lambda repressor-like predicted transcriptional regulator|nr:XRE family transcriptional regulator [Bacteroidales bacterium]
MVLDEFHIGNIIKAKLDEQGRSIAWLASKLHIDKSAFGKSLKNNNIKTEILIRISCILEYDFFKDISEYLNKIHD